MNRATLSLASAAYGLLVFAGAALLGFVVAPFLGVALGFFSIEAEAAGFFSLPTLKGMPCLVALSALSAFAYPEISTRRLRLRAALLAVNVLAAWLVSASIALAILG